MAGFGSTGFGDTPYGIGTPPDVDPNGGVILGDQYTSQAQGSRRINPFNGDYVLDPTYGRIRGMNNVQQLVLLAVSTEKGSASVVSLGQELKKIERISTNFETRVNAVLSAALNDLVTRQLISIQSITTTRLGNGRAYINLVWRDLTTGVEHEETI